MVSESFSWKLLRPTPICHLHRACAACDQAPNHCWHAFAVAHAHWRQDLKQLFSMAAEVKPDCC